jgi:steroid 5-alpha reductase family enzyme
MATWVAMLYIAKVMAAWLVGKWLKDKLFTNYKWSAISVLALGVFIYVIISKIPVIGWLAVFILFLWAWGVLANILYRKGIK